MSQDNCPICGRMYGKRKRCYYCQGRKKTGETRTCERCGTEFYMQLNQIKSGEGRYCSQACHYATTRGVERSFGTRYVTKDGYIILKTGVRKRELEHRVIMAQAMGRPLTDDEQVHHINGDKGDNRIENLMLMTNAEHQRLHAATTHVQSQSKRVMLTCKRCGASYEQKRYLAETSSYCSAASRLEVQHEAARQYWAKKRGE